MELVDLACRSISACFDLAGHSRLSCAPQALQDRLTAAEVRATAAESARDVAVTKTAQMEAALHSQLAFLQVPPLPPHGLICPCRSFLLY